MRDKLSDTLRDYLTRAPMGFRTAYASQTPRLIGREVKLAGWVSRVRDLGGVVFVILRDRTGEVQVVTDSKVNPASHAIASKLGQEDVILVKGEVRRRPPEGINPDMLTGEVEVLASEIEVLSRSKPLPYQPHQEVSEFLRLKYRYIDLRTPRMTRNLAFRSLFTNRVRSFLLSRGFIEVETPMLIKSTPEGARDFLVPSRLNPGKFYALPQSPQLLKQILMIGGIDKYFQIARCLRDEDLRADRQPEFTQIDIEMSFVTMDDVLSLTEEMITEVLRELMGVDVELPIKRMRYHEAMESWGTDKPDLRYPYPLVDLSELFRESEFKVFREAVENGGEVIGFKLPVQLSRKQLERLKELSVQRGITDKGFLTLELRDGKLRGTPAKFITIDALSRFTSLNEGETLFLIAGSQARERADSLKRMLIEELEIPPSESLSLLWIVEFPLFKRGDDGSLEPHHHPFSMPHEEDISKLDSDPLSVKGQLYDLVLNGIEIGSGSIRVRDPELQLKILELIGYPREVSTERFGFLLEALNYGAPPHGGIALGLDRIVAILSGEASIRDVIAFPKTQGGLCPLTGAPSEVSQEQLEELRISVRLSEGMSR